MTMPNFKEIKSIALNDISGQVRPDPGAHLKDLAIICTINRNVALKRANSPATAKIEINSPNAEYIGFLLTSIATPPAMAKLDNPKNIKSIIIEIL